MEFMVYLPYLIRLAVSVIIGGAIGLERSESNHEAGLRTHILVSLGAATVMVLSCIVSEEYGYSNDITRMGAQVISGVGFLGAGSIIMDTNRNKIKGITTAAGIWTTACLGLVIGMGYYVVAVFIFILMLTAMLFLRPLTKKLHLKVNTYNIHAETEDKEKLDEINHVFGDLGAQISSYSIEKIEEVYRLDVELKSNHILNKSELVEKISKSYDLRKIIIS